jgi:hypothetical protein
VWVKDAFEGTLKAEYESNSGEFKTYVILYDGPFSSVSACNQLYYEEPQSFEC